MLFNKKILFLCFFILVGIESKAQEEQTNDLTPYFASLIVSDMDSSIAWYSNIFGFEIINRTESSERGFKQANLQRKDAFLELIELNSVVNLQDEQETNGGKGPAIGFFKFGFRVSDFDNWLKIFTESKVKLRGSVVTDNISGKRTVVVLDPDGNRIQLFEK